MRRSGAAGWDLRSNLDHRAARPRSEDHSHEGLIERYAVAKVDVDRTDGLEDVQGFGGREIKTVNLELFSQGR